MFNYKITHQDGQARVGEFETPHGTIITPVFMPVGTHGAIKGVSPKELEAVKSQIVLGNTYHLYLRPGDELIASAGGLHKFTTWDQPTLTDSGGFQVFSLGERGISGKEKQALRKVEEEGITFQSHLDGSRHLFTPEKSIQIQQNLGADIIMAFDQPVYGLSSEKEAEQAMQRSLRWLKRSKDQWLLKDELLTGGNLQALFGIVQGGVYKKLHTESALEVASHDLPGNAIGGLSVGESKDVMWDATASIANLLPEDKPRYFMGLGDPVDIIKATTRGVDMYDCVAPSRLARHGVIWLPEGSIEMIEAFWTGDLEKMLKLNKKDDQTLIFKRINLHNSKFKTDFSKLSHFPDSIKDLNQYSLGTLAHFVKEGEMLGFRILTLHNIYILNQITVLMREAIITQKFEAFSKSLRA